jgi:chaperone required for assembly of F1-ATPase
MLSVAEWCAHATAISPVSNIIPLGGFLTRAHDLDESWNTLKSHDDILNYLNADIICFQGG